MVVDFGLGAQEEVGRNSLLAFPGCSAPDRGRLAFIRGRWRYKTMGIAVEESAGFGSSGRLFTGCYEDEITCRGGDDRH